MAQAKLIWSSGCLLARPFLVGVTDKYTAAHSHSCSCLSCQLICVESKGDLPTCKAFLGFAIPAYFTTASYDHKHAVAYSILLCRRVACLEVCLACAIFPLKP